MINNMLRPIMATIIIPFVRLIHYRLVKIQILYLTQK
ncbi:unnamed protein product [Schistosoma curassoni]|uniref:Uncharacterized protein n=1 Tax=Schistosoma curassoni TaxID=6186 RepID=A0A183L3Z0_9TREM|nr:unnamed protein product [Schistosoma curassoni]